MDHFEVFGLPRRLVLDETDLRRRHHELSRRYHPDFHQGAPADDQARILETSARINAAYRTLRDPIRRIEYLIRLEGGPDAQTAEGRPPAPPGVLAEMFEIQESLQEARAGALDEAGRAGLRAQRAALEARCRHEELRLQGPLSRDWDAASAADGPRILAACREALATRAYLKTVIDDLTQALDGEQETHVADHRH
jgi:molecular chaperone HscB